MITSQSLEERLAPYAARESTSRGRAIPEAEHPFRSMYQRDRDRIIHSGAFRRLEYKTQVFVNHEGDHYRTRLTHTLEVSQISRTLARALGLNEDLTEAIALAHDLGHTPFGHAGEESLNDLMRDHGGFEHNNQGLRVVDQLEKRYKAFVGLNLTHEVREAFLRHHTPYDHAHANPDLQTDTGPLLEVQLTILADEIAYDNHDIDDGLFSGILNEAELMDVPLWRMAAETLGAEYAALPEAVRRAEGVRRLINLLVTDALHTTRERIDGMGITDLDAVLACRAPIVAFSPDIAAMKRELERFLFEKFYRHYRVMRMSKKAQRFLRDLFLAYIEDPITLPTEYQATIGRDGLHRTVCDYIAGMTDRHAEEEYRKLFHPFEKT